MVKKFKKYAAETQQIISDTYGKTTFSDRTRQEWLQCFRSGDFLSKTGIQQREKRTSYHNYQQAENYSHDGKTALTKL